MHINIEYRAKDGALWDVDAVVTDQGWSELSTGRVYDVEIITALRMQEGSDIRIMDALPPELKEAMREACLDSLADRSRFH